MSASFTFPKFQVQRKFANTNSTNIRNTNTELPKKKKKKKIKATHMYVRTASFGCWECWARPSVVSVGCFNIDPNKAVCALHGGKVGQLNAIIVCPPQRRRRLRNTYNTNHTHTWTLVHIYIEVYITHQYSGTQIHKSHPAIRAITMVCCKESHSSHTTHFHLLHISNARIHMRAHMRPHTWLVRCVTTCV